MNYVYDILLNFNEQDYDFYEWNMNDNIFHIRKIPMIKINDSSLKNIIQGNICVSSEFLKKISNRTEMFTSKSIKIFKYVCLFVGSKDVVAVEFATNGKKKRISRLLLDEKEDTLSIARDIKEIEVPMEVKEKKMIINFRTRKENQIYRYIIKEFQHKNYELLKYIYFECFNEQEDDYQKIIQRLTEALTRNWSNIYPKVYEILRMSSSKKSKN